MGSKHIHFVGIGGIGMSAIARVLLEDGYRVSGCDQNLSSITEGLERLGITVHEGHNPSHLQGVDTVIVTSAVKGDNPEIGAALEQGVPVVKRAEMLGRIMEDRYGIAIAGTHGKTTTSSMISVMLLRAGLDPTILVGGEIAELGSNGRLGKSPYLVVEADEYDGSFLHLKPKIAVVTNIDDDHLDYYGDKAAIVDAFYRFMALVPPDGHLVVCSDDLTLASLEGVIPSVTGNITTYALGLPAHWSVKELRLNARGGTDFLLLHNGVTEGCISLSIPGRHNVSNALAAVAVGHLLGLDMDTVTGALSDFQGAKRRFEIKGEVKGVTVVDDYGHHPTEVKATLAAARERYGDRRLLCLFQPHTYSRTALLMGQFATAFTVADEVCVTEIYAAREDNSWGVSGADLANAIRVPKAVYTAGLEEAADRLAKELRPGDVLITMGAGDVYRAGEMVLEKLGAGIKV
ncbi:MAG: murC [Dehalococcoidia bacterium]|nr:murC [Dehalococcoidia bacterium]